MAIQWNDVQNPNGNTTGLASIPNVQPINMDFSTIARSLNQAPVENKGLVIRTPDTSYQERAFQDALSKYNASNTELISKLEALSKGTQGLATPTASTTPTPSTPTAPISSGEGVVTPPTGDARRFGWLSRRSESGSELGKHNVYYYEGAGKGHSIGMYQMRTGASFDEFMDSLKRNNPELYAKFGNTYSRNMQTLSPEFKKVWEDNESALRPIQDEYARRSIYEPILASLNGDLRKRIEANPQLQELLLATGIHAGPAGARAIFNGTKLDADDAKFIDSIYKTRIDRFPINSHRASVITNLNNEKKRLLGM